MSEDEDRRVAEFEEFEAELERVCPEAVGGLVVRAPKPPACLSRAELIALLRTLPDNAGAEAFLDAWYAAAPAGEPPEFSAEEKAVRRAYATELERVCPADEWTEPPFGFLLPGGLEHAVAVLRSLPDRAGVLAFVRALGIPYSPDDGPDR
jgi:hypothetical protein